MQKKLYRSPKDGVLLGVSSGLGHYFEKDPVIVRLIFVILAFVTNFWPMLIVYVLMFLIVPVDPAQAKVSPSQEPKDVTPSASEERPEESEPSPEVKEDDMVPAQEEKKQEPLEHMDSGQNM